MSQYIPSFQFPFHAPPQLPLDEAAKRWRTDAARALFVILISTVAALGGFLFGFDSGVINGTVDALATAFGTHAAGTGFAVAAVLLGCALGALLAGTIAERIGRRGAMMINAAIFLLTAFATGAATSAAAFIAARTGSGLAIGAASVLAPMYISEVAPARQRGRLASLQQLAIVLGLFSAFVSNYLIARAAGGAGAAAWLGYPAWRWMFWMEGLPAAALLLGLLFIPESPRFLVASGLFDRAHEVFDRIDRDADEQIQRVRQSLRGEHRPRLSDLIDPQTHRVARLLWVGVGLAALQQVVGINVIFYYGEVLWKAAGAGEQMALEMNVLSGFINILATLIAIALIDRIGRRQLLLIGSVGMIVTLATLAGVFATGGVTPSHQPQLSRSSAIVGVVAANLYVIAFGISWGPVMWVLLGEMFPNRLRGAAIAVTGATNWVANFAVTFTFLPLTHGIGFGGVYCIYTAAAILSLIFVSFLVKETRGKTLEQMEG
jgi:SP family sugar:H+ symporter-like MFS transporter